MALSTAHRLPHEEDLHAHHLQLSTAHRTRPARLLNSFLLSAITTANKLLASVGSAACEGGRWRARDHLRYVFMMATCLTVWGLRVLMDVFPSLSPVPQQPGRRVASPALEGGDGGGSGVAALVVCEQGSVGWGAEAVKNRAVGRALSHVLALLNDIPATSRKYDFTLALAERIIDDNAADGHPTLVELNRSALTSAFVRTSDLLLRLLQGSHASDAASSMWPSRALRLLPLGSRLASYCDVALTVFLGPGEAWRTVEESRQQQQQMGLAGARGPSRSESVEAEKIARELLWITRKMRGCCCTEEAIVRWSYASALASLSLTAHQRVQGPVVMITSILLREMAESEWEAPRDVRFRIIALWLPLFCYAGRGVASPVLTGPEKREMERVMEGLIATLPWDDQEVILANWLEDFTSSDSDWPNLQNCYDQWCHSSRKYLL